MKKNVVIALMGAMLLSLSACGTTKNATSTEASVSTEASAESEESTEEEEEEPDEIAQTDADALLSEKLDGLDCQAVFFDLEFINEHDYYTYSIVNKDGDELDQMLAVDAVSGEVYVYDTDDEEIRDFSEFELYDPEKDVKVDWEGTYELDGMTVVLSPADDSSFEFKFTKNDEKQLEGVAQVSDNKGEYSDDEVSLTFEFTKDGSLKISNKGNINEFAGIYVPGKEE
ncbi:hypothetical protein SAMN05216390_10387 [Lachnospiraceae bacterium KH1T2]|nr:hypothetical protein SAMN05216390_10387 [Lachnospiraceae bacterium KH1T2]